MRVFLLTLGFAASLGLLYAGQAGSAGGSESDDCVFTSTE